MLRALDDANIPRAISERGTYRLAAATRPFLLALRWAVAGPEERDALTEPVLTSELGGLSPASGRTLLRLVRAHGLAAAIIFVLVEAAIVFAVFRYRRRGDMLPPQFHGNNLLEVVWTVVPLLIVAGLFVVSWGVLNRVEAKADDPRVTVNVLGFQWQWQFTYEGERVPLPAGQPPEDLTIKGTIAKPPVMYLPVGEPIRFNT